jgi:hypothetical protein
MQQKGIGGALGSQVWVRQAFGVHKPTIRAIEMILSKPGLSFGKVMILCGGPDWPTSVLCGLLNLSLWSCEVGTTPIIFYVAPFSLSGSFLLRKGEAELWENASNVMLLLTVAMTFFYWACCAWVIQNTFNDKHDEISRKLISNIDLDWLDHRQELIAERTSVKLQQAPGLVKFVYIGGAVISSLTFHTFQWAYSSQFGKFKLSDDSIDNISWFEGDKAIIKPAGLATILALTVGFFGRVIFNCWKERWTKSAKLQAIVEADSLESAWKERERDERVAMEASLATGASSKAPVTLEDDPEKTPETHVPRPEANCEKEVSTKGNSAGSSATPKSAVLGRPARPSVTKNAASLKITDTE